MMQDISPASQGQIKEASHAAFQTFNPVLNQPSGFWITPTTPDELDRICEQARMAFEEYRQLKDHRRAEFLRAIADEILALGDELIHRYCQESGLPRNRAEGERSRTHDQILQFADFISKPNFREDTSTPSGSLIKEQLPIGPVAVFGASNFPLAFSTSGGDTVSALAAGCPVIVKGHPLHAATGNLVATAIARAALKTAMPEGVFANVNSQGHELGLQLVSHPAIKAVGFTGSQAGGRALMQHAGKRDEPIAVFAEMGSVNPVVITQAALECRMDEIADQFAASIQLGCGQFCTKPGLFILEDTATSALFVEKLGAHLIAANPQPMLHPALQSNYVEGCNLVSGHASVQTEMSSAGRIEGCLVNSLLTSIRSADLLMHRKLQQEVFGPFAMVARCQDSDEMLQVISTLEGQLTGTIVAEIQDLDCIQPLLQVLQHKVGRLIWNQVPTRVEVCEAMTHGGPFPASSDSRFTAVGTQSIQRWLRPVTYQNFPAQLLAKF